MKRYQMKIEISVAIVHALCQQWINCGTCSITVLHRQGIELVRTIAECMDYREVQEIEMENFVNFVESGLIKIG